MEEKKRILFVSDAFGYGGAEKQLAFVAEGLLSRGHTVAICNLNSIKHDEGGRVVDERIRVFVADITYKNAIKSNYDYVAFARNAAKIFKPDVIVGFKQLASFCAAVVGKLESIPSVISERADPFRAYKGASVTTRIKLWFINHADGGVFQTGLASTFYSAKIRENSAVIPNPIFINGEIPSIDYSHLPKTIVSLGRIANKQKRLDVMLDAFEAFHRLHPEYILKIYGNGEDEELLKQWIQEKELAESVKMMGVSKQPLTDMSREGIFLITSDFEGISNSLLEAMACGLPVVSTDHTPGGARLLINDGENGLLVPMGDSNAICKALCLYADDTSLAERCGRNAMKVLERFSPDNMLDKWETFLLGMCK